MTSAAYIDKVGPVASAGNSVDTMLSEARKYRLNLVLAMQCLEQVDQRVLAALLANGNLVVFRVGARDAQLRVS